MSAPVWMNVDLDASLLVLALRIGIGLEVLENEEKVWKCGELRNVRYVMISTRSRYRWCRLWLTSDPDIGSCN